MLTVRVELAVPLFGVTDEGLKEHVGPSVSAGVTEQLKVTVAVELPCQETVTVPVAELPAVTLDGESVPVVGSVNGRTAVPESVKLCVLPVEELSVTVSVAEREPAAVGVKVTVMVQAVPAATGEVQVFVCLKSAALVPVIVTLDTARLAPIPVFETVTVCGALVVSRAWLTNGRLPAGDTTAIGGEESRLLNLRIR